MSQQFAEAIEQLATTSHRHFQSWCQQQGIDEAALDEDTLTQLIEDAVTKVRQRGYKNFTGHASYTSCEQTTGFGTP